MKHKYLRKLTVIGLSFGIFAGGALVPTQASAKTKVRSYENIKNATYTVTKSSATVYSTASLTHKKGTLKSFGTKVTGYYAAHVTKNGKSSIYYKFKVGNKTGWVWHGYLKKAAPAQDLSKIYSPTELATVNQFKATAKSIGNSTKNMYSVKPVTKSHFAAGKLSDSYVNNTVRTINLARGLYGLPSVTANSAWNSSAQMGAATLAAADQGLSHGLVGFSKPSFVSNSDWQAGVDATNQSNLAEGYTGAYDTVTGYLNDSGNDDPGHREWLLGGINEVGVGQAGDYNDLRVFDMNDYSDATPSQPVAFPNKTVFPWEWVSGTRWSLSLPQSLDTKSAKITLTDNTAKKNVPVSGVLVTDGGYGDFNTSISYQPKDAMIQANHSYTVNITADGLGSGYTYTTKLFKVGDIN
ncbi:serine protease [Secundilactobacillus silagincola]|uniref:Serine protease n=1 Tax=Secundilactobacillus silagincola TaxID=1714681 RepID=A0A1Z5J2B8_9LACO|nr:CAP domain-containing protein [Secundilactobacillus silagincola]GAX08046.1 serine protease [Secundilactobacillus silagincola]